MKFHKLLVLAVVAIFVALVGVAFIGVHQTAHALVALAGLAGAGAVGMILDERTEFADATALSTAATGLALIGDVYDAGNARDHGLSAPLFLVIEVDTAVTSGGSATVVFSLASDAQAAIAVDGSATIHVSSAAIPKASLTAGKVIILPLPFEGSVPYERYLGILQNVGTAALTAGKVNAFLTADVARWKAVADGI